MSNSFEESNEFRQALADSAWLLSFNRPGEAIEKLLPLYEKRPTHPDVAINLGGAYILQRKWDRAVRVLQRAAERQENQDNVMIWMNLGAALLGRLELAGPEHQEKAIAAFERALNIDPTTPNAHYQLGLIYKERGEWNRASAFFQRAIEIRSSDNDARSWLVKIETLRLQTQQPPIPPTQQESNSSTDE